MNVISNTEKLAVANSAVAELRFDDRGLFEYRNIRLEFGPTHGVVLVSLGKTKVFAKTECFLASTFQSRPHIGKLKVRLCFSPMSSAFFESGRHGPQYQSLRKQLEETARKAIVDMENLVVVFGKWCWEVRVLVNVLNNDGNPFTCAHLAMLASIRIARKNQVEIVNDEQSCSKVRILGFDEAEPESLQIISKPIAVMHAMIDNKNCEIVDPCYLEEKSSLGTIVVIVTENSQVVNVSTVGRYECLVDKAVETVEKSIPFAVDITKILDRSIELYEKARPLKCPFVFDARQMLPEDEIDTDLDNQPFDEESKKFSIECDVEI